MRSPDISLSSQVLQFAGSLGLDRLDVPELIDSASGNDAELAESFADIARVNRYLGGVRLSLGALQWLTQDLPPNEPLRILDCGSGSCDIPTRFLTWGTDRGREVEVVATDISPQILRAACPAPVPGLNQEIADIRNLPYPDHSFDIVSCSLLLHHLSPSDACKALREMARVGRIGLMINDLVRNRVNLLTTKVVLRLMTRNRLTLHDGPASVRRAYTLADLARMVGEIGPQPLWIRQFAFYRAVVAVRLGP